MYRWVDDHVLEVGGVTFDVIGSQLPGLEMGTAVEPAPGVEFRIMKPRFMVEQYLAFAEEFRGGRIVELGIAWGGSTAFLTALLRPRRLAALEISPANDPDFQRWFEEGDRDGRVALHYETDQADVDRVRSIVDAEFGDEAIDLVVDDASHRLTPTLQSFETLFPRLRPGGVYVIEDWSWVLTVLSNLEHDVVTSRLPGLAAGLGITVDDLRRRLRARPGALPVLLRRDLGEALAAGDEAARRRAFDALGPGDEAEATPGDESELWRLVLRLVYLSGFRGTVVDSVDTRRGLAVIRRGPAELDPSDFRLEQVLAEPPV